MAAAIVAATSVVRPAWASFSPPVYPIEMSR